MLKPSAKRLTATAVLAALLIVGLGLLDGTRFASLSDRFLMVGPSLAGLAFREGIHSDDGLAFLGLMIAIDFLTSWLLVLLASELLILGFRKRKIG